MAYKQVEVPAGGTKITIKDGRLQVPDNPVIPFVEGDGTGRDIWRASVRVFDAAVEKAYGGKRKIHWMEVYADEKSFKMLNTWLPDETVQTFTEFLVGIKGMEGAIAAKSVTYDFARLMEGAKEVRCSEFGDAVVKHMDD